MKKIQNPNTELPFMEAKVKKRTKSSSPAKFQNNKGVSLYLAILVMSVLLSLTLGITAILFGQIKTMKSMGNSVMAFYAANTGIERALYGISKGDLIGSHYEGSLAGVSYSADIIAPGSDCSASYYCIKSTGVFGATQTKRAIKITR